MGTKSLRPGDVVRYTPSDRWCREGIAIVQDRVRPNGRYQMLDTFWGSSDPAPLSDAEANTAEFMFKLTDFDELDRYLNSSPVTWEKYAPADRQMITQQHGLQKRWFIRKGATPDWATQIENARQVVADRKRKLDSAQSCLNWANEDLVRIINEAEAAGHRA